MLLNSLLQHQFKTVRLFDLEGPPRSLLFLSPILSREPATTVGQNLSLQGVTLACPYFQEGKAQEGLEHLLPPPLLSEGPNTSLMGSEPPCNFSTAAHRCSK